MSRLAQAMARTQLAQLRGEALPIRDVGTLLCSVTLDGHAARLPRLADEPGPSDQTAPQHAARMVNALLEPLGVRVSGLGAAQTGELRGLLLLLRVARHLQAGELDQALRTAAAQSLSTRKVSSWPELTHWHAPLQAADLIVHPQRDSLPWHAGSWPEQRRWWPLLRQAAHHAHEDIRAHPLHLSRSGQWVPRPGLLGHPAPLEFTSRQLAELPSLSASQQVRLITRVLRRWSRVWLTPLARSARPGLHDLPVPAPNWRPGTLGLLDTAHLMATRASLALGSVLIRPHDEWTAERLDNWIQAQLIPDLITRPEDTTHTRRAVRSAAPALGWLWDSRLHAQTLLDDLARQWPDLPAFRSAAATFSGEGACAGRFIGLASKN